MIPCLVDTQLPPALARWLTERGYEAVHTTHWPEGHLLADKEIMELAVQEQRLIVTKDHDFLEHFMVKGAPPRVLLLEYGNASNHDLLHTLETQWPQIERALRQGAGLVLAGRSSVVAWS